MTEAEQLKQQLQAAQDANRMLWVAIHQNSTDRAVARQREQEITGAYSWAVNTLEATQTELQATKGKLLATERLLDRTEKMRKKLLCEVMDSFTGTGMAAQKAEAQRLREQLEEKEQVLEHYKLLLQLRECSSDAGTSSSSSMSTSASSSATSSTSMVMWPSADDAAPWFGGKIPDQDALVLQHHDNASTGISPLSSPVPSPSKADELWPNVENALRGNRF